MADQVAPARTSAGTAGPQLFARRSSGLVREISTGEALVGALSIFNLTIAAVTLMSLPFAFPGANLIVTVLLALIPAALLGGVYVLFGVALPRSGGEYVYNSRSLHPAVGFAANFNQVIWNLVFVGIYANWLSTVGLAGLFGALGAVTGDDGWNDAAATVGGEWFAFLVGAAAIAVVTVLCLRLGRALRTMKLCFYTAAAGIVLSAVVTLLSSRDSFVGNVDEVASYSGIIDDARDAGFTGATDWLQLEPTILGVALLSLSTLFVMFPVYTGGEVKSVRRSLPISIFGTLLVGGTIFALLGAAAAKTWGHNFVGAAQALYVSAPDQYPFSSPPYFNFFASLTAPSSVYAFIVNVSFMLMIVAGMIFTLITMTRCIFAWSMDRLMPEKVASVSPRTHSPNVAVAIAGVGAVIGLWVFTFHGFVAYLGGVTLAFFGTFLVTSIAAIVFPYRRRGLYEQSPLKPRLGRTPLMVILGALTFASLALMVYGFLTNAVYGANSSRAIGLFLGGLVVGLVFFFVVRALRLRQGIPFDAATTELPPE